MGGSPGSRGLPMKIHVSDSFVHAFFCAALVFACVFFAFVRHAGAQRLPTTVVPTHYTLALTPDLKTATFSGVESIDVNIAEPTQSITLNAIEIKFESVEIYPNGPQQTGTVSLDQEKQQATFTFPKTISAGNATIKIRYTGILNNELRGFYLSKTARRNYAVTQFEATDARRAFPCFDEPAFKARFDVSLTIDAGDTAISNTPIVSDKPGPGQGKHTLAFATTPKMSTYLVAFLVGDFQCIGGQQDGVDLRVCSTPDKIQLAPFALNVAKFALHYYDNYFGIHYPLKKLDLIGIPDFEAGAMENFGAITFRESVLLIDPKTAPITSQETVALDITHEMAHQWFGDLVTMQWWNNIWLNEGFATWMENKPVAAMHPEWNIPQLVASDEQDTLNVDAQPTTRPIRANAETPAEINQMFDSIAYGKASDVLLMVENYLGEETFRKGVHAYLAAHEYGNATAEDFWNAQTAASHKPVNKIMESLVEEPGVPLLTFGAPAAGKVPVSQTRFFLSPSITPNPDQKWTLPVCFSVKAAASPSNAGSGGLSNLRPVSGWFGEALAQGSPLPALGASAASGLCDLLTPGTRALQTPASGLFFANAGGKGYYRSAYAPAQYKALVDHIESALTPAERISLSGDEWAQVHANKATVGQFLDLVDALKTDSDADVLSTIFSSLAAIADQVASTREERDALAHWIRNNFAPVYAQLGSPSPNDSPNTLRLRAELFSLLGYRGDDPAVADAARQIADRYIANPASVDPNLGRAALAVAAENGDAALFDKLQSTYETSTNPVFQETALRLLMEFDNPTLLNRALNYAISGNVRNQDAAILFSIGLQIPENRDQTWQFIRTHWNQVEAQLTTDSGTYIVSAAGTFCSAKAHDDVESFFNAHPAPDSDVALKHALEHIDECVEFRRQQEPNLKSWLAAQPGL
jgi:aminopeptidase N